MTETIEPIAIEAEGMTISLLIWRRFRRPMPGLVERVLVENPGLADYTHLPVGEVVRIPVPEKPNQEPTITPVRLWG